jgi:hypothetical protein
MIPLTIEHYAAIGRIAVQSGVLERELREYVLNLAPRAKVHYGLRPKLQGLRDALLAEKLSTQALNDLQGLLDKTLDLVLQRNTVVHGVWEADALAPGVRGESIATGDVQVRANEAQAVAHDIRNARMLLLHLLHDHCPKAAAGRGRPMSDPAKLRVQLGL